MFYKNILLQTINTNINNAIKEARRNPEVNIKTPPIQKINKILQTNDLNNLFMSFRTDLYITDVNKTTKYGTPVGFYTYPLSVYHSKDNFETMEEFRQPFPFLKDLPNIIFYIAKDLSNVLSEKTPESVVYQKAESVHGYALKQKPENKEKIEQYYELLQESFKNKSAYYSEFIGQSNSFAPNLVVANFWYYLYDVSGVLHKNNQQGYNLICQKNGIYGFIDYGKGWIHPNEKAQAVFFNKEKVFGNNKEIVVDSSDEQLKFVGDEGKKNKKSKYTVEDILEKPELLNNISEKLKIEVIKQNPYNIYHLTDLENGIIPSEGVQLAAVEIDGSVIKYLVNLENGIIPSEKVQLAAIEKDGGSIKYLTDLERGIIPSEDLQLAAVKEWGYAIQYLTNLENGIIPSEDVQLAAVEKDRRAIKFITDLEKGIIPSEGVQLAAVQKDGYAIQHFTDLENGIIPSEKVQLAAVQKDGLAIQHFTDLENDIIPSEDVQLAAVKEWAYAIQKLINLEKGIVPSKKVQIAAVKKNGGAIQYIPNPSETLKFLAIENKTEIYEKFEDLSEMLQIYILNNYYEKVKATPTLKIENLEVVNEVYKNFKSKNITTPKVDKLYKYLLKKIENIN
jgi:hypothetical protein